MTQTTSVKSFSTERKILLALLVVGILVGAFFGFRTVRSFIRIQRTGLQPGVVDVEAVRGWMTVPYVARAYQVPVDYIYQQIGIPPEENGKNSISDLNRKYYFGQQGVVLEKVKTAVRSFQGNGGTPQDPPNERNL